ncbi:unnamed protein product [Cercospora beticola]|nr:unnamed protein product [Cercospora beticola]
MVSTRRTKNVSKPEPEPAPMPALPTPVTSKTSKKRGSVAVQQPDADETPAKKAKKKAELTVGDVEAGGSAIVPGEVEEEVGEGDEEEEEGDDHVYDPEAEALGRLVENDDDDDDDEYGEDEPAVQEYIGKGKGKAVPVTKKAGQRRKGIRLPKFDVAAFQAIDIGKVGPLPQRTQSQQKRALAEYEGRMKKFIHFRHKLANSEEHWTEDFPFTRSAKLWWKHHSEDEAWQCISSATTRDRQLVLGGMFLGIYDFSDLPAPTPEELSHWVVYGDLVNDAEMYGGSGTAAPNNGAAFNRLSHYEKAKRRANAGEDVSKDTEQSAHLRSALRPGIEMKLRVTSVFDPLKTRVADVLISEGLTVDYLGSQDQSNGKLSKWNNRASIQAAKDVVPKPKWKGLNRVSPFMQGIKGDALKPRILEAQNFHCELCEHRGMEKYNLWRPPQPRLGCKQAYICNNCWEYASKHPEMDTDGVKRRVLAYRSAVDEDPRHIKWLMDEGMTQEEYEQSLRDQDCKCPGCDKKGPSPDVAGWRDAWLRNIRHGDVFAESWLCTGCSAAFNLYARQGLPKEEWLARRRHFLGEGLDQPLPNDANGEPISGNARVAFIRTKEKRAQQFEDLQAQHMGCSVCQIDFWKEVKGPIDLFGLAQGTQPGQLPSDWPECGVVGRIVCSKCERWWSDRIQGRKRTKPKPSLEMAKEILAVRRAKLNPAESVGAAQA